MILSNGGPTSGAPLWLLLGTIYISMIIEGRFKIVMLICEIIVMAACWIACYYFPESIIEFSRAENYYDTFIGLIIVSVIIYVMVSFYGKFLSREEEKKNVQRLFSQTAKALVNAIDAKDRYTHGHSSRVAEYSRRIAEAAGKTREECDVIYYVALLHDVGKIGVPESIINKEGKLTDEEFDVIKQHSTLGAQILQSITEYPYISIGANYHHERYDGKGYPTGLRGEEIPEIARIISVADAYDAMTSQRSYRDVLPQDKVREQLIEGTGTQFDPKFANIMLHLIDMDIEYEMKEGENTKNYNDYDIVVEEHRDDVSSGIHLTRTMTYIDLFVTADREGLGHKPTPSMVLFDSLDARYHDSDLEMADLQYYEYAEIYFNGKTDNHGVRKI
ncbi:MAG: HD-GYP domain-containing protein, partial [Eubacterium sp.]|nr:HD-GYP domain-containing protein [Eubacterium sp.]